MDPLKELQGAVLARLTSNAALSALVSGRIYDRVPKGAALPYVSFGPASALSDDAECIDGLEVTMQIDVWDAEPGFKGAQAAADAVRAALRADLALTANALVTFAHRQTRLMRDPDGLTSHAALTFEAFIETHDP